MDTERSEILRLIRRLQETQESPRPRTDPRQLVRAIDVARSRRPAAARVPSASQQTVRCDEIHEAIQDVVRRLAHVEETLVKLSESGAASSSSRASRPPSSPGYTLSGRLRESLMSETLQLISRNNMTGIFSVETELGLYRLYVRDGEIHHGDGPGVSGESAVFAAIAAQDGKFWFLETTEMPQERTVHGNTQFLVLEALRRIDEQQAG